MAVGASLLFADDDFHVKACLRRIEEVRELREKGLLTIAIQPNHLEDLLLEKLGLWQSLKATRKQLETIMAVMPAPPIVQAIAWNDAERVKPKLKQEVLGLTIHDEPVVVFFDGTDFQDDERKYAIRLWMVIPPFVKHPGERK